MTCTECANSKLKKMNPVLPFIKTVERGHVRYLKGMIQRGDDVNRKDCNGVSVLMHAVSDGNLKCVRILLHAGVDVNAVSNIGSTALMFAAEKGNFDCMKYLIRKGADVNARNNYEETALMYVAVHGKGIQAVLALLRSPACVNVYDVYGQNALENHIANHAYVNKELAMLFFAAGEKIDGTCAFRFDKAGHLVSSVPVPEYLLEHKGNICLMQMCRKVIRQYLIAINPNQHLFHRVPQIGLPTMLSDYLLYDLSIEKKNDGGDDVEDEESDGEQLKEKGLVREVVDYVVDWREEVKADDDDSDYDPENDHDQEKEDMRREEEWDDVSNHSHSCNYYYHDDHDDCHSFDEDDKSESDNPDDEDYDPEKEDDSNDSNGEDEHYSEETEEDKAEDDNDTMDTSDDNSDSDETESDD